MKHQTIYIITPCFNSIETLDRTILSVVTQSGPFHIRYHVQDGGSTDGTIERLKWWLNQLSAQKFPILCRGINFSFASAPDSGMYDALVKGFELIRPPDDAFAGWINADDVFIPGAFSFIAAIENQFNPSQVSWVGGAATVMANERLVASYDRELPTEIIKHGLCDGTHWDFMQQEGTFFRTWLWRATHAPKQIASMKFAGDWNLWRVFAKEANYNQTSIPLAAFVRRENQISAIHREEYLREISNVCTSEERRAALKQIATAGPVVRRRIKAIGDGRVLQVSAETHNRVLRERYREVFAEQCDYPALDTAVSHLFEGRLIQSSALISSSDDLPIISKATYVAALDQGWQFPAITEKHAFDKILDTGMVPKGVTYVGFPWATLIDKLQTKALDIETWLTKYKSFVRILPKNTVKITVCQHIKLREFLYLFEEAEISHIFWSHTSRSDVNAAGSQTTKLYPFPLYPVQTIDLEHGNKDADRKYLFSFVGARANQYYLSRARSWILDELADHPQGFIVGRDGWHYEKIVYQHQIRPDLGSGQVPESLIEQTASDEFRRSLLESTFSLCPSGSGPNSIRLWESLGAGSIPVIISDTYLPPGDPGLWTAAAVFCEENRTAVAALPSALAKIAADEEQLASMRLAGRQLWLLYGPDSFVYDIHKWMMNQPDNSELAPSPAAPLEISPRIEPRPIGLEVECAASARYALRTIGSRVLLKRCEPAEVAKDIETARKYLHPSDPAVVHLEKVISKVSGRRRRPNSKRLLIGRRSPPKICLFGRHANRTPLSYLPFRRLVENRLTFVNEPTEADVLMTGFNIDLRENAQEIYAATKRNPALKLMVISEEPLWDSLWSGGFTERRRSLEIDGHCLNYEFLNHANSNIFAFKMIPYFLLTTDDFPARYTALISRHIKRTPPELVAHWRNASIEYAFFGENRQDPKHDVRFNAQSVIGLSGFRARVAKSVQSSRVLLSGKGWNNEMRRQDLPDWHLDKLAQLDGQVKILSGLENTHQVNYVSEKIIDAFAIGAIPTYYAAPDHRISELVSTSAFVNLYGKTEQESAELISAYKPSLPVAEEWIRSAQNLQNIFSDPTCIKNERIRIVNAVIDEISKAL